MTMNDNVIVKKADNTDEKEQIKALWEETFGDSLEYVEDFYETFPISENAFVALDGKTVVGMVNSLDCKAELNGKIFHGKYIYALAVKKEYRGKKIAKKLLEVGESDIFTMLIPERTELFAMYGHLGYTVNTVVDAAFIEPHKFFGKFTENTKKVRALVKSENTELENAVFYI